MKHKYGISFFITVCIVISLLSGIYYWNYCSVKNKYEAKIEQLEAQNKTVTADGTATKEDGYYIKDKNGYVVVYEADKTTIFEETNITIGSLPEHVQEEIADELYLESIDKVYGFLEGYSS
ncbi:hypothetical protein ACTQ6A_02760 [Lachnospiraceae bacterium LCP25S3_G4]